MESVSEALETALAGSDHLLAPRFAATIAAARQLAVRVDSLAGTGWTDDAGRLDNVAVPTFLKYLDALGMTVPKAPAARGKDSVPEAPVQPAGAGATITALQDRAAGRRVR